MSLGFQIPQMLRCEWHMSDPPPAPPRAPSIDSVIEGQWLPGNTLTLQGPKIKAQNIPPPPRHMPSQQTAVCGSPVPPRHATPYTLPAPPLA